MHSSLARAVTHCPLSHPPSPPPPSLPSLLFFPSLCPASERDPVPRRAGGRVALLSGDRVHGEKGRGRKGEGGEKGLSDDLPERGEQASEENESSQDTDRMITPFWEPPVYTSPRPQPLSAGGRRAFRPHHAEEHVHGEGGAGPVHDTGLDHRLPARAGRGPPRPKAREPAAHW